MSKSENQKLKLLYIAEMFYKKTDEEHGVSTSEIIDMLDRNGISVDRRTVYNDIECLRDFGMDIDKRKEYKDTRYFLISRDFELPEIKLLVDAVQASRFISVKKTGDLIKKLENLASVHEASQLNRQVIVPGKIKNMNESVLYSIDAIHDAINENKSITFKYYNWNIDKELVPKNNGKTYEVSPYILRWADEYYYLVAYDNISKSVRHYRVDKMKSVTVSKSPRIGSEEIKKLNPNEYASRLFGMFGGTPARVTLTGKNDDISIVLDRFGKDIVIMKKDEDHFNAFVDVILSQQFLGWMAGVGNLLTITAPDSAVNAMKDFLTKLNASYNL